MRKIAMISRRQPYGDINAAEAVRHALGGASSEMNIDLVLIDGGVLLAKKGQNDTGTGFTNLGSTLKDCIDMGVNVFADKNSIREHLETEDLIDGIKIVSGAEVAEIIKEASTTIIF